MYKGSLSKCVYLFVLVIFSSCVIGKLGKENGHNSIVLYPPSPEKPRIQFLTKISTASDIAGHQSWFKTFILGREKDMPIIKPYGLSIFKDKIYICDKKIGGLEKIDLNKGKFEYFIPSGKGQLQMPLNCYVDTNGYLYVADAGRSQVVIYDEMGNYKRCFGDTLNFKPTDVFVSDKNVWVANMTGHKIDVYGKDSLNKWMYSFGQAEPGKIDYLYAPTNVYVKNNKVYVTDFGDFKIKIFSLDGKFLDTLGSYGTNPGQLAKPKGIAVDRDANIYVVDAAFENVQIFNSEGKLLLFFGGPYKGPGDMWLPSKVIIDYDNLKYFQKYVAPGLDLKYLVLVCNQFGPDKINVYGYVEPAKTGAKKK